MYLASALTAVLAYLLGSVPFAVVVSKCMGLADPRSFGSHNPGATNVLRTGNKKAAALTLLGDLLKGTLAVLLTKQAVIAWELPYGLTAVAAVAVFIGHVFPISLGFKGGKGVATALGVIIALQPLLALLTALTWLIVFTLSRYSSLSAIVAALLTPMYYFAGGDAMWPLQGSTALALLFISAVLLLRHISNIRRLLTGTETKVGAKKE